MLKLPVVADVDPLAHRVRDLGAGDGGDHGVPAAARRALHRPSAPVPRGEGLRHQGWSFWSLSPEAESITIKPEAPNLIWEKFLK